MPNPPTAPNFMDLANQQGAANLDAARQQARLNNPNFNSFFGGQQITYGPDGQPNVNQTLNPQLQGLFNQYFGLQGQAGQSASNLMGGMGGINFGALSGQGAALDSNSLWGPQANALDPNSLAAMPGNYDNVRNQVIDAMMGRANRDLDQRGDQMNSDLIARGLRPGTEAYTREQDALNRQRNDALQQAQIAGGNAATQAIQTDLSRRGMTAAEQAQRFGQMFSNRGQSAAEQAQRFQQMFSNRGQGFGEQMGAQGLTAQQLQMLLGASKPNMPNMPGFQGNAAVAPAPIFGAGTAQSNYEVDLWNAMMQQQNSRNTGLFNLGNSFMNTGAGQGLLNWGGNALLDWWRGRGSGGGGGGTIIDGYGIEDPFGGI